MSSPPPAPPTERTGLVPGSDSDFGSGSGAALTLWQSLIIGIGIWLLVVIEATNMSGMAIIQDTIGHTLSAPAALFPWFTTAYLMALSTSIPLVGRLAVAGGDANMPRRLVLPAAVVFCGGALLAALAPSAAIFIAGRVLAAVGGGAFLALAFVFVLALVPEPRRGIGLGLVNAAITVGVSLGAAVYGALLPLVGWRPLFWMQAPVALATALAVFLCTPASLRAGQKDRDSSSSSSMLQRLARIDYLGAVLLCLTVVLFLYGLAGTIQPLALGLSLVSLLALIACEYLLATDPVLPLTLLSSRGVLLSCLAQMGLMAARWSLLFFAPIFVLAVHDAPRAAAGSVLVPTNLGFALGGILVGSLHIRRAGSFWLSCLVALASFAASMLGLSAIAASRTGVAPLVVLVFVNGFTTGAALNYTMAHLLHLCHPGTDYVAASLLATFRGFGGSFGTFIGGGIFYSSLRRSLVRGYLALDGGRHLSPAHRALIPDLLGTPELVSHGGLSYEEQQVALNGYANAIGYVWRAAAVSMLLVMVAQAATGWTAPEPPTSTDGGARGYPEHDQ